jgi:antitoxin component of MazEF toxin-antitoxin module
VLGRLKSVRCCRGRRESGPLLTGGGCNTWFYVMIKTISKIGNSQGIIFDSALLQLARLKVGDEVNVEVHAGGTITVSPIVPMPPREEMTSLIKDTMKRYSRTMKRLA